jgi:hypothetical protein
LLRHFALPLMAVGVLALGGCSLPGLSGAVRPSPSPTGSAGSAGRSTATPDASPSPSASGSLSPSAAPTGTPTPTAATPTPGAPLVITSLPWHQGEVGVAYGAVRLGGAGGTPPYRWSVSAGALPTGLSLSGDGTVSGTPSVTGAPFTVRLDDSAAHAAGVSTTIPVAAQLAAGNLCGTRTGCQVESGCVNVCGGFGSQSGGVGPFQYTLTGGSLPTGTSLSGLSVAGTIRSSATFAVQVKDALGAVAQLSGVFFNVFAHLVLFNGGGGGPLPNGPATVTMALTAHDLAITRVTTTAYKVASFSYDGKTLTLQLTGTWNSTTPPPFQATVYDSHPCGVGVNCSSTATITLSMG